VFDELQDRAHTALAIGRKPVEIGAAKQARAGADAKRLQHVEAIAYAAVEQ
jgi:hypothetical protein